MARLPNYIPDTNPFHLAGPPNWFLSRLMEFDPSLYILPSRQGFYYKLAQKRKLLLAENVVNDVLREEGDTKMLASYGLIPITTILATVHWDNPLLFIELARRAPWRMGGAKAFEEQILAQERAEQLDKAKHIDEHTTYLAKDSWRLYNKKIGTRSHMWSPTVKTKSSAGTLIKPNEPKPYKPLVVTGFSK